MFKDLIVLRVVRGSGRGMESLTCPCGSDSINGEDVGAYKNTDISVSCGTQSIDLNIYLCPMYQASYNESLMVLNNQFNTPACLGTADWTAVPPVLKFRIPLNETVIAACGNSFKIMNDVGSGTFSDFSSIQSVNISGSVTSSDPSAGAITYRSQLLYKFSCYYPLQYLLNNTQVSVSGVNVAIRDNNGTFISTLSMQLYKDPLYQEPLTIPPTGLNLKTKIYVSVKATNLTQRFNVLLDRCYATTSPYPTLTTYYDLFVGCTRDPQTKVELNGASQKAQFSFEAFRFVEHKDIIVSTFYLHCTTRLCEVSTCSSLLPVSTIVLGNPPIKNHVDNYIYYCLISSCFSSSLFTQLRNLTAATAALW
uniref:ZP domain-containing protein n=1 Tax=Anabas testudineus TaxID=64144 RepID=A0A3Q1K874_ANATE